jgi:hypothetical protein
LFLAPAAARAQNIGHGEPTPDWDWPLPLMLDNKESGFYFAPEAIWWKIDNPLKDQVIAFRGFIDIGGFTLQLPDDVQEGTTRIFGSGTPALRADDASQENYQWGWRLTFGYRFRNDVAVEFVYWKLMENRAVAGASIVPPGLRPDVDLADTFVTAPFFNFSPLFGGPQNDVDSTIILPGTGIRVPGPPVPAFGVNNAADDMTIEFVQRTWSGEFNFRLPIHRDDCSRSYMLIGPRYLQVYERFRLRMVDLDINGEGSPLDTVFYVNEWENRFYGAQVGMGGDQYLGNGFAIGAEGRVGLFADVMKANTKYERADHAAASQNWRKELTAAPMFQGGLYLWWYPIEGIQVRLGYEVLGLFNVPRSNYPVDFNVGRLTPDYEEEFLWIHGGSIGVAFIF